MQCMVAQKIKEIQQQSKSVLLKQIQELTAANESLKAKQRCRICHKYRLIESANVLLPCGHITCAPCANRLIQCYFCNRNILGTATAYLV